MGGVSHRWRGALCFLSQQEIGGFLINQI